MLSLSATPTIDIERIARTVRCDAEHLALLLLSAPADLADEDGALRWLESFASFAEWDDCLLAGCLEAVFFAAGRWDTPPERVTDPVALVA